MLESFLDGVDQKVFKKCWGKESNPFTLSTAQDTVDCCWCQGSVLAQAQLTAHKLHKGLFSLLLLHFASKDIQRRVSWEASPASGIEVEHKVLTPTAWAQQLVQFLTLLEVSQSGQWYIYS